MLYHMTMSTPERFWEHDKSGRRKSVDRDMREALEPEDRDEVAKEVREQKETLHVLLDTNGPGFEDSLLQEQIYNWYQSAMSRRHREPLTRERFRGHFFDGSSLERTCAYGDTARGYVLGINSGGLFIPTHFAPKNVFTGYSILNELANHEGIPTMMAITEDLANTILKMPGWHALDIIIPALFRGKMTEKRVVYNSHPDVIGLMIQKYAHMQQSGLQRDEGEELNRAA